MNFCQLRQIDETHYACTVCGIVISRKSGKPETRRFVCIPRMEPTRGGIRVAPEAMTHEQIKERVYLSLSNGPKSHVHLMRVCDMCGRVPGVLAGMVASGLLAMDTEKQLPETVYHIVEKPIDVVYPLGTGSRWSDNELRYSLRSLEKNFPELGRVFIVGRKPAWLTGVEHIPFPDKYRGNKDANLITKVLAACEAGISKEFIRLSDDELFPLPTRYREMVALHWGDLKEKSDAFFASTWKSHLRNTRNRMASLGLSTFHFDTHTPNAYDREKFKAVMADHPWEKVPMTINTLYYNATQATGRPANSETVSFHRAEKNIGKIRQRLGRAKYLNYNDAGLTLAMKTMLEELFPEPSKYELAPTAQEETGVSCPRGIVTLAGGPTYATNAYINCRMLRHMGCTLPIEWCYLGAEMSPAWIDLIEQTIPNCRLVDLGGDRLDNAKKKGGWQAKVDAVIQSRFAEVLFLDADSFPLRDPADLFEHTLFQTHDCILWPDVHTYDRNLQSFIEKTYGVKVKGRQIESGQMLFRKKKCLPGLLKTQAINRDSKEAYKHLFGDKDTFLIGAKQGRVDVIVNPHAVRRASCKNLKQLDFDGKPMFIHLTHGKWGINKKAEIHTNDYPQYPDAVKIFEELQQSNATIAIPRTDINMKVRDTFCAIETSRIINEDTYKIRPMVGHQTPVKYIVDIGGNAGAFTYAASACYPESEIIVIEPDPELMADIRYNTKGCRAKIHYIEAACVGTECESNTFIRRASHRAGSFIRETEWGKQAVLMEGDEAMHVLTATLPDLLERFKFPSIDILKIDAEGVEPGILTSLKETGWMPRIHWVRGEWHGRSSWPIIDAALSETHVYHLQDTPNNGELIAHNIADA